MQSSHEGQSLWKSPSSTQNSPDFLYDGLPSALQELLSTSATKQPPTAAKERRNANPSRRILQLLSRLSRTKVLLVLLWVFVLWWGERHIFYTHIARCRWQLWEQWGPGANPHRLVLLADPQLVDPHTYPGRPWPLSTATVRHTDQYLRRSFRAMDVTLDAETVFFLGDLFDGGREWSTPASKSPNPQWHKYGQSYWLQEYERFGKAFLEPWKSGTSARATGHNRRLIADLPGNHDLGLGSGIQLPVRQRFHTFFGLGDRVDTIGNHTFVSIDSVSLSAKSQQQPIKGDRDSTLWEPSEAFLSNVQKLKESSAERAMRIQFSQPENALQNHHVFDLEDTLEAQWEQPISKFRVDMPTVLLSHVPFHRQPGTPCGPLREHWPPTRISSTSNADFKDEANSIRVTGFGYQYQNVLNEDLSQEIVDKVGNVRHIFSGDDHDYCHVIHNDFQGTGQGIPEITVKSTSWAMGVRKPGFLLVSLWNPVGIGGDNSKASEDSRTIQTHLCLLPDQLRIFIRYGLVLIFTVLVLAIRAFTRSAAKWKQATALLPLPVSTPTFPMTDNRTRGRAGSASYASSANSNDCNGLAVRSNAGRSRPLSPAHGYGFEHGYDTASGNANGTPDKPGFPPPLPEQTYQIQHASFEREKRKDPFSPVELGGWRRIRSRCRASLVEVLHSVFHVGTLAFLWYVWLAYNS